MKKDELVVSCSGIQSDPFEPLMEENFADSTLQGNEKIKAAIHLFHREQSDENYTAACHALRERMAEEGHMIFPADITENAAGCACFHFKTVDIDEMTFLVAFTDQEEYKKAPASGAVSQCVYPMLENIMQQEEMAGMVINPWGEQLVLCKADIANVICGS